MRVLGPRGSPDSETILAVENGQELKIPTGQVAIENILVGMST